MTSSANQRAAITVLGAAAATWLAVGPIAFAVVGVLGVAVWFEGEAVAGRHAALAALACFVASVVSTIYEQGLEGEPTLRFTSDRPVTSSLGTVGAAFLIAGLVLAVGAPPRGRHEGD